MERTGTQCVCVCVFPRASFRINSASGCAEIQVDDSLGKALGHSNELEKRACSLRHESAERLPDKSRFRGAAPSGPAVGHD